MFYQQGEVILEQLSARPKGLRKIATKVLVRGKSTSNEHKVVGAGAVFKLADNLFLNVTGKCTLRHPEHLPIELPKGWYAIKLVREYDHFAEEARAVED